MTTTRGPGGDAYVHAFMGGDAVAFLEKVRTPLWLSGTMLVAGVVGAVASASTGSYLTAAAIAALTTVMAAFLMELRVAVTSTHVHIQYGTFGPQLALADIARVEVVDYQALVYGGWGIRRGLNGGVAYSVPGRGGKAVRLTTRDGRIVDVTSEQPAALCAAIEQARGATTSALSDARHDVGLLDAPQPAERALVEPATAEASRSAAAATKQR